MAEIMFGADAIDGYLLAGNPSKAQAIETVLRTQSDDPKAAPFYRALQAVGTRAADEALIALRLILAGIASEDAAVTRVRGFVKTVRAGGPQAEEARAAYAAMLTSRDAGNT
jgi:hypothetical protein